MQPEDPWNILRIRRISAGIIDLKTSLYAETENSVKCWVGISKSFLINSAVRQECVLVTLHFNTYMDCVLDKVVDQSRCGAFIGNIRVTNFVFADNVAFFTELLEILLMAIKVSYEDSKPLGLKSKPSSLETNCMKQFRLFMDAVKPMKSQKVSHVG